MKKRIVKVAVVIVVLFGMMATTALGQSPQPPSFVKRVFEGPYHPYEGIRVYWPHYFLLGVMGAKNPGMGKFSVDAALAWRVGLFYEVTPTLRVGLEVNPEVDFWISSGYDWELGGWGTNEVPYEWYWETSWSQIQRELGLKLKLNSGSNDGLWILGAGICLFRQEEPAVTSNYRSSNDYFREEWLQGTPSFNWGGRTLDTPVGGWYGTIGGYVRVKETKQVIVWFGVSGTIRWINFGGPSDHRHWQGRQPYGMLHNGWTTTSLGNLSVMIEAK